MSVPDNLADLTALFEKLGAREPQGWASSQLNEGIPQLHRFLFLRQAWSHVISEDSVRWVDYHMEEAGRHPTAPFAEMGAALNRAVAAGLSRQDLSQIARGAQAEFLCQLS